MSEGRYEALGRALYRAMQVNPDFPALSNDDVLKQLMAGLNGIKPFIEEQLAMAKQNLENSPAASRPDRQATVDELTEELKWLTVAIDRFGGNEKRRLVNEMDQKEVPKNGK